MSEPQTLPAGGPSTTDPGSETVPDAPQFDAIVQAAFSDTVRSSGSLESNASSSLSADGGAHSSSSSSVSASTSQSVPSLTTSSTATTASAASSKTPSPCPSILRSNSAPPSAFPTLPSSTTSSPNVTFAPLPQVEPRKRNSSHPLGVAARSRLLRHRRMLRERGLNPDDYQYQYQYQHQAQYQHQYAYGPGSGVEGGQGFPADPNAAAHPYAYGEDGAAVEFPEMDGTGAGADEEQLRMRRARTASDVREEEDPFVALGKLVKGAGKTLWKSLSMRDMRAKAKDKDRAGTAADGQPRTSEGDEAAKGEGGPTREKEKEKEAVPRRSVVGTGHLFDDDGATPRRAEEEGGVWEEEVTEDSWKKLLSDQPPSDTPNGDANDDGQATPTPAFAEPAVLTTIVAAQPSTTKAR